MLLALDIGRVCLELDERRCLAALGLSAATPIPDSFRAACAKLECGQCREDEWLAAFHAATGHRFRDDQLRDAFCAILGDPVPGMTSLLNELIAADWRLIFFSDVSALHLREVFRKYEFPRLVTGAVTSYEVGAHKPAAAMFQAFERDFGQPSFYVDDRPENIAAASARGWPSHCFASVCEFRTAMARRRATPGR